MYKHVMMIVSGFCRYLSQRTECILMLARSL